MIPRLYVGTRGDTERTLLVIIDKKSTVEHSSHYTHAAIIFINDS